ncbi:RNA polymerase-associated protein rtf1, partial [Lunasporangiospora selenospora]
HSSDEEISEGDVSDRSDDQDEDDDDDHEDDDGPVDEYDAEYFGDAKDRAELMAMSEVDREQILYERAKKRTILLDQRQVAKRLKRQEEADRKSGKGSGSARDSARRSTRAKDSKAGSTKALADLKRAQERKKVSLARRSHSPEPRRRRKGSIDYSSDNKSETPSSGEDNDRDEDEEYDSEPEKKKSSSSSKSLARKPATLEELNAIRMTRDRLEKWCYSPFFKDTVIGCYVRISIGQDNGRPVYRIAEVISVGQQNKIYSIGKTSTNLNLLVKHGRAEKTFTMDFISNSSFSEDEFRRYEITLRNDKLDLATLEHVENKKQDIQAAKEYVLTSKEVEDIIEYKKQMKQGRLNPIVHRNILQQQMMVQSQEEAEETVRRLQALKEAEHAHKDMRADKLDVWAKLNERNRNLNRTSGRQAEERQALEKKSKTGGNIMVDPFARRKTTPRMYYDNMSTPTPGTPSENVDSGTSSPLQTGGTASPAAAATPTPTVQSVAATPAMPQSKLEELIASNKDEFDIDIDLSDI